MSILSNVDKILEKLMHRRLIKFFGDQKIFLLKTIWISKENLYIPYNYQSNRKLSEKI